MVLLKKRFFVMLCSLWFWWPPAFSSILLPESLNGEHIIFIPEVGAEPKGYSTHCKYDVTYSDTQYKYVVAGTDIIKKGEYKYRVYSDTSGQIYGVLKHKQLIGKERKLMQILFMPKDKISGIYLITGWIATLDAEETNISAAPTFFQHSGQYQRMSVD